MQENKKEESLEEKNKMQENKKEESLEKIKSRLREELEDLYIRYGLDMVKMVVDEDDLHEAIKKL